jgi:predicted adenine nucleotide alpha hydrolase (AANH) superfamily ATPase
MLVHICCSVDSHFFLESLKMDFPDKEFVGFFYDPNIHPYSEYQLRLLDVRRSCKILNIPLIEGEYDYEKWLKQVHGLEDEPEKGERCKVCFDNRLEVSVKKALELGKNSFTTSLLVSPKKSQDRLLEIGNRLAKKYGIDFIFKDYRSNGGMQKQSETVKNNNLYRQDYCGCIFALKKQREQQEREQIETYSSIGNEILPASIEEKFQNYSKIKSCFEESKENILNYRIHKGRVLHKKEVVPSYFLFYSFSERKRISGRIERVSNNIAYLNRESVKIVNLDFIREFFDDSSIKLPNLKVSIKEQIQLRTYIDKNPYSLSPIIVLDEIPSGKVDIELEAKIFASTVQNFS